MVVADMVEKPFHQHSEGRLPCLKTEQKLIDTSTGSPGFCTPFPTIRSPKPSLRR